MDDEIVYLLTREHIRFVSQIVTAGSKSSFRPRCSLVIIPIPNQHQQRSDAGDMQIGWSLSCAAAVGWLFAVTSYLRNLNLYTRKVGMSFVGHCFLKFDILRVGRAEFEVVRVNGVRFGKYSNRSFKDAI